MKKKSSGIKKIKNRTKRIPKRKVRVVMMVFTKINHRSLKVKRCRQCKGKGVVNFCQYCDGSGKIYVNVPKPRYGLRKINCLHCRGKGKSRIRKCDTCLGLGFLRQYPALLKCEHKKGNVSYEPDRCPLCKNSGKKPVKTLPYFRKKQVINIRTYRNRKR